MKKAAQLRLGRRTAIAIISVSLAVASTFAFYYFAVYIPSTCMPSTAVKRIFTIIVDSRSGYNGSLHQPLPYPVMIAQKGDAVMMRLVNNDSAQTFGLAIEFYAANGIVGRPGETKSLCFQATKTGQFIVSDPIFTTIDVYEKAQLNVG